MNSKSSFVNSALIAAVLLTSAFSGCASCDPAGCYGGIAGWSAAGPCYGYVPTCWRPWNPECPPCPPPHALLPAPVETIEPPVPSFEPPAPSPAEPSLPAVPPESSEEQPAAPPLELPTLPPLDDNPPAPRELGIPPSGSNSQSAPLPTFEPVARSESSSRRHWIEANYTSNPVRVRETVGDDASPLPLVENPFIPARPGSR